MIINKIISMIHITLVGFMIFLTVSFIVLFMVLQHGVVIENVDFSSVKAKELYIKWNEKLLVTVDQIEISTHSSGHEVSFDVTLLEDLLKNTKIFLTLFERIELSKIDINNMHGSFYYADHQGKLIAQAPQWSLLSRLFFHDNELQIVVESLQSHRYDTKIDGTLTLHMNRKTINAALECHIANDAHIAVAATATTKAISFNIHSLQPIKNLLNIVEKFELDPVVTLWAIKNITAPEYTLEYLRGVYEFHHPETLLATLEARAHLPKMHYTFSPTLAPIVTEYTDVHFNKGILHIRPHNGNYLHHPLPQSYLDIDFSQNEFFLNAHIITTTTLDDAILKILNTYHIALPLQQTQGVTQSDLNLTINLHTLDTTAEGTFSVKEGDFLFKGEVLHVENLALTLDNTHVNISQGNITYNDIIEATIEGDLDPVKNRANLLITPKYITLDNAVLDTSTLLVQARYTLNSNKETLSLSRSQWRVENYHINVDPFEAPFHFEDFSLSLPDIGVTFEETVHANVSGDLNVSRRRANIELSLNTLHYHQLSLDDATYKINLHYQDHLSISTQQFGHFQYNKQKIKVAPLQLQYNDHRLTINKSKFYIQDRVNFQLQGEYLTQMQQGLFQLSYIHTFPQDFYSANTDLNISYKNVDGTHRITAAALNLSVLLSSQGWWINIPDISNISEHSALLKHYNITDGNLSMRSTDTNGTVSFNGRVHYPYALLIDNDRFIYDYSFEGSYHQGITQFDINNKLHVNIADTFTIDATNVGFNIPEFQKLLDTQHDDNDSHHYLIVNATDSFLYLSKKRRAPIDEMHLYKDGKTIYATLQYAQGQAQFELDKDNNFHLYGDQFNDTFMNSLLALAEHQKGSLYFYISGKPEQFQGVLRVKKTILKDYKVINNMLAFVNTLPALTTFSLPQYSSKGLRVKEAYAGFTFDKNNITVHDISIDSKELRIQGNGKLNFKTNSIDMQLALKTDLGSKLSKVPIVGYLLFGDDGSVSTTLSIMGKLDNPTVTNAVAEDIIVAPFQLLKRAILLPVHLIETVQ